MVDPLSASLKAASSALYAQSQRIRIATENMANANTTSQTPGGDPYRRRTITFAEELSRAEGVRGVSVRSIGVDQRDFKTTYDPGSPAADARGYVKQPNVDPMVELADLRDANRSYQANIQIVKQARDLVSLTIDLMKS